MTESFLWLPMQYANAHAWYKNLDKLIHYANADGRVNVFYSRSATDQIAGCRLQCWALE
jgi:hypothetical protein